MRAQTQVRTDRRQASAALVEPWLQELAPENHGSPQFKGPLSSDAAAVMRLDPNKSALDLWREKVGSLIGMQADLPEKQDTGHPAWESMVEPLVASVYSKRTGNPVRRVSRTLEHPAYPWMLAHLRWDVLGTDEVQHLLCMNPGAREGGVWDAGVPEAVRVGVMHLLAVTGQRAVDIALLVSGRDLRVMRVARDEGLIQRVFEKEAWFWEQVQNHIPVIS